LETSQVQGQISQAVTCALARSTLAVGCGKSLMTTVPFTVVDSSAQGDHNLTLMSTQWHGGLDTSRQPLDKQGPLNGPLIAYSLSSERLPEVQTSRGR
jgi:hypothetical protein